MASLARLAALVLLAAVPASAAAAAPVVRSASEIEWKASGSLPPGAEYVLLYEDPATHAVQTLVRMPRGYVLPPHSHTHDELMLVLKGRVLLRLPEGPRTVDAGGYAVLPGGTVFSLKAAGFGGAQFLASFDGPYDAKPAPAP